MAKKKASAENFDLVVTQSNKLIEAAYPAKLSARAHKIARFIIALINPADPDLRLYTVKIDYLKKFLGFQEGVTWGGFADELNDIFNRLTKDTIYIKDENEAVSAKFLASVKTNAAEQTVTFEISQQLKPYLIELKKNFTTYQLRNIPKLKSVYSIRLYELLTQYRKIGYRTFQLEELQKKMGSDYALYGDFKRKALAIAQRDLENFTDIRFEYDELKEGRRVAAIKFYMYPNRPQPTTEALEPPVLIDLFGNETVEKKVTAPSVFALSDGLREAIEKLGIARERLEKMAATGFELVSDAAKKDAARERCKTVEVWFLEKLTLTEQSKNVIAHGNPAGFFVEALREDWVSNRVEKVALERKTAQNIQSARDRLRELEKKREELLADYNRRQAPIFRELSENEAVFSEAWESATGQLGTLRNQILNPKLEPLEQYRDSPLIAASVHIFWKQRFPDRFSALADVFEPRLLELKKEIENVKKGLP